jgi:Cd2+/Zn2+-exporting ATPase
METLLFRVHGMDCADEVAILKKALAPLGLSDERLSFDLLNGTMGVQMPEAPEAMDDQAVVKAVTAAGLRAERLTPAVAGGLPSG